ncbi:MAG: FecR domain-containing protein [Muribaculaceae bacterium]|nr:FecR domain-containing protein [Muribaculaceae bacterium]
MVQLSEDIIIRFINNTCTDDELVAVRSWLDESDDNARQLFELEQIVMQSRCMSDGSLMRTRIADGVKMRLAQSRIKPKRYTFGRVAAWASGIAAMIAVIAVSGIMMLGQPDVKTMHVAATSSSRSVILPDSTVVYLNRNSTLSYPELFVADRREVTLDGEGYFEVTKDREHPFVVNGKYLSVEVLGTKFNFISRDTIDNSVSLLEGSVEVLMSSQNEGVVLAPGQKASYNVSTGYFTVNDTKAVIDAAWHDRLIPFENANIGQICDILIQLYDVDIELDPRIDLAKTYSGVTVYYDKVDSTLTRLGYTIPIDFDYKEGHIVISPKK